MTNFLDKFLKSLGDTEEVSEEFDDTSQSVLFQSHSALPNNEWTNELEELKKLVAQHEIILQKLTSTKRSFQNDEEMVIHELITEFLASWNKSFRCAHFYRGECKFEDSKCFRIHDNSSHTCLAKELRSILLHGQSEMFRELCTKCKNTNSETTCEQLCILLTKLTTQFNSKPRNSKKSKN